MKQVCAEVKKASQRTTDLKCKASEANEKTRSHRERSRIICNEHTRSGAAVNHSFGFFGWCEKETAAATHSLTCGVLDRENSEIRYLKQATEHIEEWQLLLQEVHPVNARRLCQCRGSGKIPCVFHVVLRYQFRRRTLPYGLVT